MDCCICCEPFNKRTRKLVECPKCESKMCGICIKKYLAQSLEDPHCMSCKNPWDTFFLNSVLPRNYMTSDWKTLRSQVLFEKEKSFFPETIPLVNQEIQLEKLAKEIEDLTKIEKEIRIQKDKIFDEMNEIRNKKVEKEEYKRKCTKSDCKGFINKAGVCGLCESTTCMKCNIPIQSKESHTCDEQDVKTWDFVQKNSKPCPNCGTRIQRSQGCAQMWCPGCHKAFNWNTGKIENGPVHNPHYYEYIAKMGTIAPPVANECCNVWDFYQYRDVYLSPSESLKFRHSHQKLNHIVQVDLINNQRKLEKSNNDLRIGFIRSKITEEEYKKSLIKRETQNQKLKRLVDIQETIRLVVVPLLQQVKQKQITYNQFDDSMKKLLFMVNESVDKINKNFKCSLGFFSF